MAVPVDSPMKHSTVLPRDGRQWFYWYPSNDTAVEVQIGGIGPWLATTAKTDPNGVAAYAMLVAGEIAAVGSATLVLPVGRTWIRAREVGTEIDVDDRGFIDCT